LYGRGYQQVRFGPPHTPDVIKYLLIANVAVFLAQKLVDPITSLFSAVPWLFWEHFFLWQPFTYMWLHAPQNPFHLLFNMLALWMFGSALASVWGERRFLRFYLLSGVGAGLLIVTWPALLKLAGLGVSTYMSPTLGASGAVYATLLAYSLTWPDRTIMLLFPPIPIKAIWFIPFLFAMEMLFPAGNVSHVGHLGGILAGWILFRRMTRRPLLPSLEPVRWRLRRWRMRRRLRELRGDEERWRPRDDDWRVH
jgi:membrane associated rhomboid family serine protease